MNVLRRLRAIFNIALFWGLVWAGAGMLFTIGRRLLGFPLGPVAEFNFWAYLSNAMLSFAAFGGGCSTLFSLILLSLRRREGVEELNWKAVATFGAVVGVLLVAALMLYTLRRFPTHLASWLPALGIFGVLGAVSAVATLAVARRAPIGPGKAPLQPLRPSASSE